jgi:hypothetical protein
MFRSARWISEANAFSRLLLPSSRRTLSNSFTKPFDDWTRSSGGAYCGGLLDPRADSPLRHEPWRGLSFRASSRREGRMNSSSRSILARSLMTGAASVAFMMANVAVVRAQTVIGAASELLDL